MELNPVTRLARKKYGRLLDTLDHVRVTLDEAADLINHFDENLIPADSWSIVPFEVLKKVHKQADNALTEHRKNLKRFEAELIAKPWKVS